jgi:hypothetical protein
LLEICRIARFRLADLIDEPYGGAIIAMLEDLAAFSESGDAPDLLLSHAGTSRHCGAHPRFHAGGGLTCTSMPWATSWSAARPQSASRARDHRFAL